MSLDAMDWVWTLSKSKGVGRLVMLALADKARPAEDECKAYGSQRWLASKANCTQEAVTEALPVLYKLGELEIIEGASGPYGATYYRLPKAIGHQQPSAANRPTHSVDSKAKASKKSTGSLGHPSTDSLGRSDAESTGSADHNTTSPPKTTTSVPTDPPASTASKGGGGGPQQEAETFLQSLPEPWTAGRKTARDLAPLLLDRITEQGWQLDTALVAKLTANPGGVQHFASVLKSRIDDLPKRASSKTRDSPTTRPGLPPHCGSEDCNPHTRMRTEPGGINGYPVSGPCRTCHPDMIKDAAA